MYGSTLNAEEDEIENHHRQQSNNEANLILPSSSSKSENEDDDLLPVTYKDHLKRILSLAFTFAATYLCMFSFTLLAASFLGRIQGPEALSGFGLGVTFVNFLGFSTITGMSLGLDTLLPQAVGISESHPQIAKLVQRAFGSVLIWVCLLMVIFVSAPHWFGKLGLSDDSEQVAVYAGRTIQTAAICLLPYLAEEILQSYLGAMSRALEILFGAFCGAVLNPILLYFFIQRDYVGFDGAVISWCLCITAMFFGSLFMGKYRGAFESTWKGFDCNVMFTNWSPFLRAAFPAMLQLMCEWSCYEVNNFASAFILPKKQFTSQVLLAQFTTFLFPVVLGCCIPVNILVGSDIGAKRPESAKKTAIVGTALLFVEFAFDAIIIYSPLIDEVGRLFTDDQEVLHYFETTFRIAFISHVFDALFCMCGSIIRAMGHQRIGMILAFTGYWCVGLPLGWILAIFVMHEDEKVVGLWIGPCVGQCVAVVLGWGYVIFKMEWVQTEELANDLALEEE